MTDRPVNLRLGVRPDTSGIQQPSDQSQSGSQTHDDIDPNTLNRFKRALAPAAEPPEQIDTSSNALPHDTFSSEDIGSSATPGRLRSPFDLFSRSDARNGMSAQATGLDLPLMSEAKASEQDSAASPWSAVSELIDQMLISDGADGRRAVRVSLADASLPEVTASVYEDAGAWVADFECGLEASYRRLAEPSQTMAERMAAELGRDTTWLVRAPDLGLPDVVARARSNGQLLKAQTSHTSELSS
ncbi:MAG: hypothetical protein RI906_3419 [Pseudomonadota bacterium]|jgi:hypothetical protein